MSCSIHQIIEDLLAPSEDVGNGSLELPDSLCCIGQTICRLMHPVCKSIGLICIDRCVCVHRIRIDLEEQRVIVVWILIVDRDPGDIVIVSDNEVARRCEHQVIAIAFIYNPLIRGGVGMIFPF